MKGNVVQKTQGNKNRLVVAIVIVVLALAGAGIVVNLFMQSLTPASQIHDHDGDGVADH